MKDHHAVVSKYRDLVFKSFNTVFMTEKEEKLLAFVDRYFYKSTNFRRTRKETQPTPLRLNQAFSLL
jgi:hypothetical protein